MSPVNWIRNRMLPTMKILADAVLLAAAFAAAFLIRFDGKVPTRMWQVCVFALPWIVLAKITIYWVTGMYKAFWRYSGINDLKWLALAQLGGLGATLFIVTMSREATYGFPRGIYFVDLLLSLIFTGALRFG